MTIPRFLVFVPAWQAERYVARALESALAQDYPRDRFRVVCVVDASPDGTFTEAARVLTAEAAKRGQPFGRIEPTVEKFATWNEPMDTKTACHYALDILLMNPSHLGVVGNTWNACHHLAEPDEIVVQLDGDDRLAHSGVLTRLAEVYDGYDALGSPHHCGADASLPKDTCADCHADVWLTYGSYASDAESRAPGQMDEDARGISRPLDADHTRRAGWRTSHLRSWKAWLFNKIRRADLEHLGTWIDAVGDHATMLPMLEMAGAEHARYIHEILYLKNDANPLCEHKYKQPMALAMAARLMAQPRYLPLAGPDDTPDKEGE